MAAAVPCQAQTAAFRYDQTSSRLRRCGVARRMTRLGLCCAQPWYRHGPIEIVGPPDGIATGKFDVLLLYCSRRQRLSCTLTFVLYLFVFHLPFCIACRTNGLCDKPRSISCIGWFRPQLQWKLSLGCDGTGYRAILVHDRHFSITFDNFGTSS